MPRELFQPWYAEHQSTRYPFADRATLTNGTVTIPEGTFVDGSLYPIGAIDVVWLSSVTITASQITLTLTDGKVPVLATASFPAGTTPSVLAFTDVIGRPAGILVAQNISLGVLAGWGIGQYMFTQAQTQFSVGVVIPTPEIGVRGFQLADGTVLTGDVWFVGGTGVQLSAQAAPGVGAAYGAPGIRVDIVGDTLTSQLLCGGTSLYSPPLFVQQVTFVKGTTSVVATPDATGDIKIFTSNALTPKPVLRIRTTTAGVEFSVVGNTIAGA